MAVFLTLHGIGPAACGDEDARSRLSRSAWRMVAEMAAASPHDVRLTFDDGNRSDVDIALPVLQPLGRKAAFFISTDMIGRPGYMDAADIRALHRAGMEIGSHGAAHVGWTGLGTTTLLEQLARARAILEDIVGVAVDRIAIPFGRYDRRVLGALKRAGTRQVFTSDSGPAAPGAWLVTRNTLTSAITPARLAHLLATDRSMVAAARTQLRMWRRRLA